MPRARAPRLLMHILIVRLSAMGDLVQTLPALTDAVKAFPEIRFDWVVDESFAQVPAWHPQVDRVIPTAFRRWGRTPLGTLRNGAFQSFVKQLRTRDYDLIVDVQGGLKSAFAARLAKGVRAGHDARGVHDWGAQFLYQKTFRVPKGQHSIQRMRQLLSAALGYEYVVREVDYGIDHASVGAASIELPQPYLVFIHSTSWSSKVWAEQYWTDLARLAAAAGFNVVLPWGDSAERGRSERIAAGNERAIVLPQLSISEKATIISRARATVGLDTGLSHIAAAFAIPSVTIYGATDPLLVGATGKNQVHLTSTFECVRCHQAECNYTGSSDFKPACLVELKPDRVWQELEGLMVI